MRAQKDTDARWIKKNGVKYFGYKNHINVDVKHKLVRKWTATPASTDDSQVLEEFLDEDNSFRALWADSAYRSWVRARVEHVFGFQASSMNGKLIRCVLAGYAPRLRSA